MTSQTSPGFDDPAATVVVSSGSEESALGLLRQSLAAAASQEVAHGDIFSEFRQLGLRCLETILWPHGRSPKQVDQLVADVWAAIDDEVRRHPRLGVRSNPVQLPTQFFKQMLSMIPGRLLWLNEAHISDALVADTPAHFADAALATLRVRLRTGVYKQRSYRVEWWQNGSPSASDGGKLTP